MATVQLNVRLDQETVAELDNFAREQGLTKSALARMATLNLLRSLRNERPNHQPEQHKNGHE